MIGRRFFVPCHLASRRGLIGERRSSHFDNCQCSNQPHPSLASLTAWRECPQPVSCTSYRLQELGCDCKGPASRWHERIAHCQRPRSFGQDAPLPLRPWCQRPHRACQSQLDESADLLALRRGLDYKELVALGATYSTLTQRRTII